MGSLQKSRKLFTPLRVGDMTLSHRVILAPLTRARCPDSLPGALNAQYYSQRTSPGALLISEGTHPSIMGGNYHGIPGIFTTEQIEAWKIVTNDVHAKGGYIFCQLWHVGRQAVSIQLGGQQPISSSATKVEMGNRFTPQGRVPSEMAREMTIEDIEASIQEHVHAAKCAIEAGFDGVELQAANGYLIDQYLNPLTNHRTDAYGGSPTNRSRLLFRVLDAITTAIGASKTAVRFSPFGTTMMPFDPDPLATYTPLFKTLDAHRLAYICLTQPRSDLFLPAETKLHNLHEASKTGHLAVAADEISLLPLLALLKQTPRFCAGGYDAKNCFADVEAGVADGVVFGKWFISNPDLAERIRHGWPLEPFRRETFYEGGAEGYTDYAFYQRDGTKTGGV